MLVHRSFKQTHKLGFKPIGPRRIVGVKDNLIFEVGDMIRYRKGTVHAKSLRLYKIDIEGEDIDNDLLQHAERISFKCFA